MRECAIQKADERILAVTSRDIVAAEAHYHISCYKKYTVKVTANKKKADDGEDTYQIVEKQAFANLFEFIRTDVIPNKRIVSVTSLTSKLESFMLSGEVKFALRDSTRKHVRRRLESEFLDSIRIFQDAKGKLLLVPDNVTLQEVAIEVQSLRSELEIWQEKVSNCIRIIDQASSKIRSEIKENTKPSPWPFHPSDSADNLSIPYHLERFLVGLLTGDPDTKCTSYRVSTLVQSFSQDLIYAVTCGKHKPPKHFLLPCAVKTLTGNVEMIQILNRFGHGVSYSQLEENETALCLQKLATESQLKVTLPTSIKPHIFTNLAWDNIDRLEETLTGKGTSHRVNGIAVQAKVHGPFLPAVELPHIERKVNNRDQFV